MTSVQFRSADWRRGGETWGLVMTTKERARSGCHCMGGMVYFMVVRMYVFIHGSVRA